MRGKEDPEITALKKAVEIIRPLPVHTRARVVAYLEDRFTTPGEEDLQPAAPLAKGCTCSPGQEDVLS